MSTFLKLAQAHTSRSNPGLVGKSNGKSMREGMTLLEITFVLLVMVAIIGGALVMASGAMNQSNSVQESQTVNNLAAAVQKTKTASGFPANAAIGTSLNDMGLIPANVTNNGLGTVFTNSWGGAITFLQKDAGGNFAITYAGIPQTECKLLVQAVKSGILKTVGSGVAATTLTISALTTATISATICPTVGVNSVIWSSSSIFG